MTPHDYPYTLANTLEAEYDLTLALPEHRLCLGVITQAVQDYMNPETWFDFYTAKTFLLSESTRDFGFVWMTEHLVSDPLGFREGVRQKLGKETRFRGYKRIEEAEPHTMTVEDVYRGQYMIDGAKEGDSDSKDT